MASRTNTTKNSSLAMHTPAHSTLDHAEVPILNEEDIAQLKVNLNKLATKLIDRFGKVTTAFRAFDLRIRGKVTFSDFAYAVDQLKLGFDRNTILKIFTYMDYDKDSLLKYNDFCTLCADKGTQGRQ